MALHFPKRTWGFELSRSDLRESISLLVREMTSLCREAVIRGSLRYRFLPYVRATLQITRSNFVQSCVIARTITAKAELFREDHSVFMKNSIESLDSFRAAVQLAEAVVNNPKWAPRVVLRGLAYQIAEEMVSVLNGAYSEFETSIGRHLKETKNFDDLVDLQSELPSAITKHVKLHKTHHTGYVNRVLADLYGESKIWDVKIWLTGIHVNTEVMVGEGYELRTPTASDLTFDFPLGHPPSWLGTGNLVIPASILQIKLKGRDQPTLSQRISRLMKSLLLLNGGIDYWRYSATCGSVVENREESHNINVRAAGEVVLGTPNKDEVEFHMRALPEIIPDEIMRGIFNQETGLAIAYQKYEEVMRTQHTPWDRVNSCIIGLEAIFLEKGYERGKGRKLARRAAPVLASEKISKTSIRRNITNGYSIIRNNIVHGTPLTNEDRQLSIKILGPLVDYVRRSIILLIQEKKEDFHI